MVTVVIIIRFPINAVVWYQLTLPHSWYWYQPVPPAPGLPPWDWSHFLPTGSPDIIGQWSLEELTPYPALPSFPLSFVQYQ